MDPDDFLTSLGDFLISKAGAFFTLLANLQNAEITQAVDTFTPEGPFPPLTGLGICLGFLRRLSDNVAAQSEGRQRNTQSECKQTQM